MEIQKTKRERPYRLLFHGDHGTGKSSLAAAAPAPLFIQTEDGLDNIETEALPFCETFEVVMEQLTQIYQEKHSYQTLNIDSLDWVETLIYQSICRQHNKESIADFDYGRGYRISTEQFGRMVAALRAIRDEKGMNIILIAHSDIQIYNNPLGQDYDQYKIKLRDKNTQLFTEWADLIGFIHFETYVKEEKQGFKKTKKGIGGDKRTLSVVPSAGYVSKNRYGITDDISLPSPEKGWQNLINSITGGN